MDENYTLVINNSLTRKVVTKQSLKEPYFLFSADRGGSHPCDVYTFQVTALNDVGVSEPSDAVEHMLPTLPQNITSLSHSLKHSISKTGLGVLAVTISFQV